MYMQVLIVKAIFNAKKQVYIDKYLIQVSLQFLIFVM